MRIAFGVEYLGTHYIGWQKQPHARSVQASIEAALSKIANHPVTVVCAGRTDTGVHAVEQIIHADVTAQRTLRAWVLGTNSHLPTDITILWAKAVDEQFHARFTAIARQYRYLILNRPTRPALLAQQVAWEHRPLQHQIMQQAANYLIGTHDFTSYRTVACQAKSPIRTIYQITIYRHQNHPEQIVIDIRANGFLHHMVRNIIGVLIPIGCGEQPPQWAQTVLQARDRRQGGITAPAGGLYLYRVEYPPPYSDYFADLKTK